MNALFSKKTFYFDHSFFARFILTQNAQLGCPYDTFSFLLIGFHQILESFLKFISFSLFILFFKRQYRVAKKQLCTLWHLCLFDRMTALSFFNVVTALRIRRTDIL